MCLNAQVLRVNNTEHSTWNSCVNFLTLNTQLDAISAVHTGIHWNTYYNIYDVIINHSLPKFYWSYKTPLNISIDIPQQHGLYQQKHVLCLSHMPWVIIQTATHNWHQHTVNREKFAGLNFHSFQEYHESFSVNLSTSL